MTLAIVCAVLGLILIYIEFFLPNGVMGISGGVLVIASIFLFIFLVKPKTLILLVYMVAIIFAIFLVVKLALKHVKKTKSKNTFFLEKNQEGFVASMHQKELYGKEGIASSDLKTAGHILINNEYYQAVSREGYIKKGEKVEVIGGEGARLVVKKI